jgi:acyl-CoA synthetase (AMP-forming)/AMP-acid ligase II
VTLRGPAAVPSRHATIVDALANAAASAHGLTFVDLRERETAFSFAELAARARIVAQALIARGVQRGDRVAIVLPTCVGFVDAFFGALLAGAVAVPLYPPVRLGRLEEYHAQTARTLTAAGAKILVTDARVRRLLGEAVLRARPALGCVKIEDLLGDGRPGALPVVSPDDLALIQFSSGSTVDPKPVALDHHALVAQCASLEALFPKGVENVGVSWLPLYHDMGLIGALLSAVHVPGPLVLIPPEHFLVRPASWLRAIARHRATISPAPNFAYALAAKRVTDADLEGCDLSSWRLALDGAEPIAIDALDRFAARFAPFGFDPRARTPVYGLAEAALAVTFTDPGRGPRAFTVDPTALAADGIAEPSSAVGARAIVSVGRPLPGFSIEIRDEHGAALGPRRVGRIFVRGPSIMRGYFGAEEATARALVDGWLDTGDLGFVDGDELHVCGREKDVVIVRGANHAPQEFEEPVEQVDGVRPGCVVALGSMRAGTGGEGLLLLVEHASGATPAPDLEVRVRQAVLAKTGIAADDVRILPPGTLPRTSSGKLRRREALRRHLTGTLTPPSSVSRLGLAAAVVRSELAHAVARLDARSDVARLDARSDVARLDARSDVARLDARSDVARLDARSDVARSEGSEA